MKKLTMLAALLCAVMFAGVARAECVTDPITLMMVCWPQTDAPQLVPVAVNLALAYDMPSPTCGFGGWPDCPPDPCYGLTGWAYFKCEFLVKPETPVDAKVLQSKSKPRKKGVLLA